MDIAFLAVTLLFAVASLEFKNSISAIISFALMMLMLGVYYLYLNEQLLGLFQIFVYTGGVAVLILLGMAIIGTDSKPSPNRLWAAFGAFAVFVLLVTFFYLHVKDIAYLANTHKPSNLLFSRYYSDFTIILALIGSSLLYATVKMIKVLKPKRRRDV